MNNPNALKDPNHDSVDNRGVEEQRHAFLAGIFGGDTNTNAPTE